LENLRSTELETAKAAGAPRPQGIITVDVDACRRKELLAGPLLSTTLLRTDATGYFVTIDDIDLHSLVSDADFARAVPPCT
jgi:hypothetical protein